MDNLKETTNRVRTILLLAVQDKIKPKAIMDKFECSIEDAINYLKIIELHSWGKSEAVNLDNENQGWLTLNHNGIQKAEDMRNEERWNKVLKVCNAIDNYSLNTALEILNRCIVFEIQTEINKQYTNQ